LYDTLKKYREISKINLLFKDGIISVLPYPSVIPDISVKSVILSYYGLIFKQ